MTLYIAHKAKNMCRLLLGCTHEKVQSGPAEILTENDRGGLGPYKSPSGFWFQKGEM